PDVNEDMAMFKSLGLNPQKAFVKAPQPETVEATASKYHALGEKPKWTRPEHKIERNETAKQVAKAELKK
ncbi:MAG: biotin synthase, partial [Croceitalea sp.]|nr:biotin synthase [Croceitalea sp.]